MFFRVIFDYGDIEIMVMTEEIQGGDQEVAVQEALENLGKRGFSLPVEDSVITVEKAPEWGDK